MEFVYFINLIFIFVLNVFFFFSGVCLNSVVIISFWRSVQLRKKLCYFMIMVLSCCDLLAVLINNPSLAVAVVLLMTGKLNLIITWRPLVAKVTTIFLTFSLLALLVMNFDRYLATSYPFIHRTSVTKGRLLTLLAILIIIEITLAGMSVNDAVISNQVHVLILFSFLTPSMLFFNCKLFIAGRKGRRKKISPEIKKSFSLKNISSCLLAAACYGALSIPGCVFAIVGLQANNAWLAGMWAETIASMNCTFNCLIFYWKNTVLRTQGWNVIKSIKKIQR